MGEVNRLSASNKDTSGLINMIGSFAGEVLGAAVGLLQLVVRARRELGLFGGPIGQMGIVDPCDVHDPEQARRDDQAWEATMRVDKARPWEMID